MYPDTGGRIDLPLTSTIGFGLIFVSSLRRVPSPPANITAFIITSLFFELNYI